MSGALLVLAHLFIELGRVNFKIAANGPSPIVRIGMVLQIRHTAMIELRNLLKYFYISHAFVSEVMKFSEHLFDFVLLQMNRRVLHQLLALLLHLFLEVVLGFGNFDYLPTQVILGLFLVPEHAYHVGQLVLDRLNFVEALGSPDQCH